MQFNVYITTYQGCGVSSFQVQKQLDFITKKHVGDRDCQKPLGRSVRESFNKQEPSNFYYCKVGPIWLQYSFCMICTNLVKLFLLLQDIPKLGTNLVKRFLLLQEYPKPGLFCAHKSSQSSQNISSFAGMTKSRDFASNIVKKFLVLYGLLLQNLVKTALFYSIVTIYLGLRPRIKKIREKSEQVICITFKIKSPLKLI